MLINPPSLASFSSLYILSTDPFSISLSFAEIVPATAATARLSVYSMPDGRSID